MKNWENIMEKMRQKGEENRIPPNKRHKRKRVPEEDTDRETGKPPLEASKSDSPKLKKLVKNPVKFKNLSLRKANLQLSPALPKSNTAKQQSILKYLMARESGGWGWVWG